MISGPERSFVAGNSSLLTFCRSFGIGKTCTLLQVFNTVCLYFCIWWLKDTFRMFPEGTVYVFMSLTQGFLKEVKQVLAKCWALSTPGSYNQHSQIKGLLKSHQEAVCSTLTGPDVSGFAVSPVVAGLLSVTIGDCGPFYSLLYLQDLEKSLAHSRCLINLY